MTDDEPKPAKWVLFEYQWLDSSVDDEWYELGEFDSVEAAEAYKPEYARQRGQVVESIDFVIKPKAASD